VLRGDSPGTEPLQQTTGKREAGTRELITWVGTRAPIPNTLVPSAARCVGLADLSVMPPEESERTVAPIPKNRLSCTCPSPNHSSLLADVEIKAGAKFCCITTKHAWPSRSCRLQCKITSLGNITVSWTHPHGGLALWQLHVVVVAALLTNANELPAEGDGISLLRTQQQAACECWGCYTGQPKPRSAVKT